MVYSTVFGTTTTWTGNDIDSGLNGLVTADINSTYSYAGVASGTNAITASLSQAPSAYAAGQRFVWVSGGTNTGATTINFNSLGAISLYSSLNGLALVGGEITSGSVYEAVYYNSKFYLLNVAPGFLTYTPTVTNPGAQTYAPTFSIAKWSQKGKEVTVYLKWTGTLGGTPAAYFGFSLPVTGDGNCYSGSISLVDAGGFASGQCTFGSTTRFDFYRYNAANYTAGTVSGSARISYLAA